MASGVLINDGQQWIIDRIANYVNGTTDINPAEPDGTGLYVGLMTNYNTPTPYSAQLPTNIVEVSGGLYARQLSTNWTIVSGTDPYMQGDQVTFNVSGTWENVYGYFVSETSGGNDALWTELFPAIYGGDKLEGDTILITPKLEIKDENES